MSPTAVGAAIHCAVWQCCCGMLCVDVDMLGMGIVHRPDSRVACVITNCTLEVQQFVDRMYD